MTRRYSNVAVQTTLASGVTASDTTIPVSSTSGFPAVDFVLALDYGTTSQELVLVTGVAGTTLTVTRGYDSTPATAHDAGAVVVHTHSAADFADSRTHEAATANVHGITGGFVGTTDAQVLSNKDLTASSNSFPTTLALASDLNEVSLTLNNHTTSTAAHGATGANVGTTNVQTLTNKTLSTGTKIGAGTDVSGAWVAYTPTWTAATTAPSIGNGSLTGRYMQAGKTVDFAITLSMGSTTSFGSGAWAFSLPVTSLVGTNGSPNGIVRGPANRIWYPVYADANSIQLATGAVGVSVDSTTMAWSSVNTVYIIGRYEAA